MEKRFRKSGYEKVSDNMRTCRLLLNRLINDNYSEIAMRSHDKKWGELEMSSEETNNPHLQELVFDRPNIKSEKDKSN